MASFNFKSLKMSNDNSDSKGCLIFALIAFGLAAIKPLLALIFGASTSEIYSMESYDRNTDEVTNDVQYLRTTAIVLVIAVIIYLYNRFKSK